MTTYAYTGRDRRGIPRTGRVEIADVRAWVQQKFDAGWRSLAVRDETQRLVGEIGGVAYSRARWWSA